MPRASIFMSGLFAPGAKKTLVHSRVLTPVEAATLSISLREDARDMYYSAWVTFLDALHGINKGFYSWAAVKLYYTVFYALRASLAFADVCAFHVDRSSFTIIAQAGNSPVSCKERGTHKTVLKTFEQQNAGHLLMSQQIDLQSAIDWLIDRREEANYRKVRFGEPDCSPAFDQVAKNGLRKLINGYLAEPSALYVFDPDHAILAYALRTLQIIGGDLAPSGITTPSADEQAFLRAKAKDQSGNLSALINEMKRLAVL